MWHIVSYSEWLSEQLGDNLLSPKYQDDAIQLLFNGGDKEPSSWIKPFSGSSF